MSTAPDRRGGSRPWGALVAVWGPMGAPGRTTVAVGLAGAAVDMGLARTLVVDADLGRGTVAAHLGAEPGGSTLPSACAFRAAGGPPLTPRGLQRPRRDGPWVLAGLARPRQGGAVAPAALGQVLDDLRGHFDLVIADLGAALPPDPGGEGHGAVLRAADMPLAVCAASPVGLGDVLIQAPTLAEVLDPAALARVRVVLNHAAAAEAPRYHARLEQDLGLTVIGSLPHDHAAVRQAQATRRPLAQAAPRTLVAASLRHLTERVLAALAQDRQEEQRPPLASRHG